MLSHKSFVLSASFPSSKLSLSNFEHALHRLDPYHFSTIEYYCEGIAPGQVRSALGEKIGIFLAAAREKSQNLLPSSTNPEQRNLAVRELVDCMHFAAEAGSKAVLFNSGLRPSNKDEEQEALKCFEESIIAMHLAEPDLELLLEPGDRDVEYRHLIGPIPQAAEFVSQLRSKGLPIGLTFDISHVAQLGESVDSSWKSAKNVSRHIHLANCVLNKASPIYGDKHPLFGIKDSVYQHEDAKKILSMLSQDPSPLTVGIEMICPPNESEDTFFQRFVQETAWFFEATF